MLITKMHSRLFNSFFIRWCS